MRDALVSGVIVGLFALDAGADGPTPTPTSSSILHLLAVS